MTRQLNLFKEIDDAEASAARANEERAEKVIDRIAEAISDQQDHRSSSLDPEAAVEAVRQSSRAFLRLYRVDIPVDTFERLVRELCWFNFLTDEGAPS
jgi:hypothetical protein